MSDCYCDYDAPSFYRADIVRARKAYRCGECGAHIRHGDRYEYVAGKWDSDVDTYRTCERCLELRMWTQISVPCLCWSHGNMIDDCSEAIKDARWRAPEETVGLWFSFLRRLYKIKKAARLQ
jgi:hypothetical protein